MFGQENYELSERTIRSNGKIYHVFKPNNFREKQNPYQDKISMDMTLDEVKNLTSTCCNEKNQPLTIEMTKD